MRTLVLSIGNSTLRGGVFSGPRLVGRFQVEYNASTGADASARALIRVLPARVDRAVLCSVVPARTAPAVRCIREATGVRPRLLRAHAVPGVRIAYRDPRRLGADRLAGALGARVLYPRRHIIVVDCGTATTVTALHRDGIILGGAILPGIGLWPAALAARTAQLPEVSPDRPRRAVGRTPEEAVRSGIFHGHAGAIREVVGRVRSEAFGRAPVVIIGTGGQAPRFRREQLFSVMRPDLLLTGLHAFASRLSSHA
jgi:type III pantothenate kinase